jgi:hypothetical protein
MSSLLKLVFWGCVLLVILKVLMSIALAVAVIVAAYVTQRLSSMS